MRSVLGRVASGVPSARFGAAASLLCILACSLGLSACGGDDDASNSGGSTEQLKIAAVFPFTLEGNPYNQAHLDAITAAAEKVGKGRIEVHTVFNVPYTKRATQTYNQLFQQGNDVVIDLLVSGTLFDEACEANPDKICLGYGVYQMIGGDPSAAPNLGSYFEDDAVAYYAEGVAAGALTKTGVLGFANSFDQGFTTSLVNAFALGCQSVRPDCKVRNVYINSFFDPPKTIEATNTLIDAGADVITHFVDDSSPLTTAQERGVWGFGIYEDQSKLAPDAYVGGPVFAPVLQKILEDQFRQMLDGTWKPGSLVWGSDKPPDLPIAPYGEAVPDDVKAAADAALEKVAAGENPFTGPIYDASGKVRVPKGESIAIRSEYMYTKWLWPVRGVTGL